MAFDPREVLLRPLMTEKSTQARAKRQYVFQVANRAAKGDIRRAVEALFKVRVRGVRTIAVAGKPKRMGRWEGFRVDWKKAVVTVAPGQEIDFGKV